MKNFMHLTLACYSKWAKACTTKEQLAQAWHEGADFKIYGGPYTSVRDREELAKDTDGVVLCHKDLIEQITF